MLTLLTFSCYLNTNVLEAIIVTRYISGHVGLVSQCIVLPIELLIFGIVSHEILSVHLTLLYVKGN